jgi:hypothetical protein
MEHSPCVRHSGRVPCIALQCLCSANGPTYSRRRICSQATKIRRGYGSSLARPQHGLGIVRQLARSVLLDVNLPTCMRSGPTSIEELLDLCCVTPSPAPSLTHRRKSRPCAKSHPVKRVQSSFKAYSPFAAFFLSMHSSERLPRAAHPSVAS